MYKNISNYLFLVHDKLHIHYSKSATSESEPEKSLKVSQRDNGTVRGSMYSLFHYLKKQIGFVIHHMYLCLYHRCHV